MQVYHGITNLPPFQNAVLTIGTFDGVHKGHQKIIEALKDKAEGIGGETVVVTFDPHPRKVVQPHDPLQLINTLEEKIALLQKAGIDNLVVVPFTKQFAALSAEDYIEQFLVKTFKPAVIVIGYDHHFGKNRQGNFDMLNSQKRKWGYELIEIPAHIISELTISSTKIRNALLNGNVTIANDLLGYSFFFSGKVEKGDALGRTLGYPTANLQIRDSDKIMLGDGVYAVYVAVKGATKKGLLSIGTRPTLVDNTRKIEVYIFEFSDDIYREEITVTPAAFIREQIKFDSLETLIAQMDNDAVKALQVLH